MKLGDISAWSASLNRTRKDTTKPWSRVHRVGTKAVMIHGPTFILFFISSRALTGNSRSVSARFKVPRVKRPVSSYILLTRQKALSVSPIFRTNARMSVWI
jgi:hypothetical protein